MQAPTEKSPKRFHYSVLLSGIVLAMLGSGYAAWSYFDSPPLSRYSPVLIALQKHQIRAGSNGVVDLSQTFPGLTPKDRAYLTWNDDGTLRVMFPTYYGEGTEVAGLLYTNRPLRDEEMHHRASAIHFGQQLIDAGTYGDLLLEKRIDPNWYHVSYKLQ